MIQKLPKIEHIGEDYVNVEYFDRETNELTEYELPLIVADIIETFEKCSISKQKVREAISNKIARLNNKLKGMDLDIKIERQTATEIEKRLRVAHKSIIAELEDLLRELGL